MATSGLNRPDSGAKITALLTHAGPKAVCAVAPGLTAHWLLAGTQDTTCILHTIVVTAGTATCQGKQLAAGSLVSAGSQDLVDFVVDVRARHSLVDLAVFLDCRGLDVGAAPALLQALAPTVVFLTRARPAVLEAAAAQGRWPAHLIAVVEPDTAAEIYAWARGQGAAVNLFCAAAARCDWTLRNAAWHVFAPRHRRLFTMGGAAVVYRAESLFHAFALAVSRPRYSRAVYCWWVLTREFGVCSDIAREILCLVFGAWCRGGDSRAELSMILGPDAEDAEDEEDAEGPAVDLDKPLPTPRD